MIAETKVTGQDHESRPTVTMRTDGGTVDLTVDSNDPALTRRITGELTGVRPEESQLVRLTLTGGAKKMAKLARRATETIEELER